MPARTERSERGGVNSEYKAYEIIKSKQAKAGCFIAGSISFFLNVHSAGY
jgi:hypothetical protein